MAARTYDLFTLMQSAMPDGAHYLPAVQTVVDNQIDALVRPCGQIPEPMITSPGYLNFFSGQSPAFKYPAIMNSAHNVVKGQGELKHLKMSPQNHSGFEVRDSGGFQLCKGTWSLSHYQTLWPTILAFQLQAKAAISLDAPTEFTSQAECEGFDHCLSITMDGHDFTASNLPLDYKTIFLNSLQGENHVEREKWWRAVRTATYCRGWAFSFRAFGKKFLNLLIWLTILHANGDLKKCRHIHILGAGHLLGAVAFSLIARAMRRHLEMPEFHFTYDMSSPFKMVAYGRVIHNWRFSKKEMTFDISQFPDGEVFIGSKLDFPYATSPIGRALKLGDIVVGNNSPRPDRAIDGLGYAILATHNLYVHLLGVIQANRLAACAINNPRLYELPIQIKYFADALDLAFSQPTQGRMERVLEANRDIIQFFDVRRSFNSTHAEKGFFPDLGSQDFDDLNADVYPNE